MQRFTLKENRRKHGKDNQGDYLLDDLQLHKRERTSVFHKTNAVCWNLEKVLR